MPKRITVVEHLRIAELEQRYKQATGGVESRQLQIIWLLTLFCHFLESKV